MNKLTLMVILLTACLSSCALAPATIQHSFKMQQGDQLVYHFDGYTDAGDNRPGAGNKYLEAEMKKHCPDFTVIREGEEKTNGGIWLIWDGEAKCNKGEKSDD